MGDAAVLKETNAQGLVTLTINNPARRNAYSAEVKDALSELVPSLMDDDACRAIVLTGAGSHFSAGGDISQMRERSPIEMRRFMEVSHRIVRQLTAGPKPVVAAVEGYCYGAGFALALACDYVVASRDARFCAVFMRIGLLPDVGLRWTLTRRVGPAKAQELIMLTTEVGGEEAARIGIANSTAEPGQALAEGIAIAERLAGIPPLAFALNKAAYSNGTATLKEAIQNELSYQPLLKLTSDHREAIKAFREKRKPVFTGR
jgi:enoyl-CoA hydratase/carnithine racemase